MRPGGKGRAKSVYAKKKKKRKHNHTQSMTGMYCNIRAEECRLINTDNDFGGMHKNINRTMHE